MSASFTPTLHEVVGGNLRRLRESAEPRRSQQWLADALGVSRPTVAAIEAGKTPLTVDKMFLAIRALQCAMTDLYVPHGEGGWTGVRVGDDVIEPLDFMSIFNSGRTFSDAAGVSGRPAGRLPPQLAMVPADEVRVVRDRVVQLMESMNELLARTERDEDA